MGRKVVKKNNATLRDRITMSSPLLLNSTAEPRSKTSSRLELHENRFDYKLKRLSGCLSNLDLQVEVAWKSSRCKRFVNHLIRCKAIILDVAVVRGVRLCVK
jgi:hypothetical protein